MRCGSILPATLMRCGLILPASLIFCPALEFFSRDFRTENIFSINLENPTKALDKKFVWAFLKAEIYNNALIGILTLI